MIAENSEWLQDMLEEVAGITEYTCRWDMMRGVCGMLIVNWVDDVHAREELIDGRILINRDPIDIVDCFFCSKCGARNSKGIFGRYRIIIGSRSRNICKECFDNG